MTKNDYLPFSSKILEVIPHTDIEYTFRMSYNGDVKPGQFFEVSLPKYGEAPISVSGIGPGFIDLTIRRVGKVTNEIFEHYAGSSLLLRGPYGNGFRSLTIAAKISSLSAAAPDCRQCAASSIISPRILKSVAT